MARYQILYWRYIPLGVKAIDINGMVRQNLPASFQDAFQTAAFRGPQTSQEAYTTSGFRWTDTQDREGTAAEVARAVVKELIEDWDEAKARAAYEARRVQDPSSFLDLKKL